MTNTSYQNRYKKENDSLLKGAKIIFAICFSVLLVCVALFGGAALGNKDITNTVLENEQADTLEVAEGGTANGGSVAVGRYFSTFGTFAITNSFGSGNVHWTRYYSGSSHGNQDYNGAGFFGNGGSGTVRQKVTISSASTNFAFTAGSVAANLQKAGLLSIQIKATVRSKNGYDGNRKVGYKLGSGNMSVDTGSSLLSGFTTIAEGNTNGNNQTKSGTSAEKQLSSSQSVICIGVGGYCNFTAWVGGRYPGQQAESITFIIRSKDTTKPTFTYPSISGTDWKADTREVKYVASDNVQIITTDGTKTGAFRNTTTKVSTSVSGTNTVVNMSFTADHRYTYTVKAVDSAGNLTTTSSRNYANFKLDGFAPKILRVIFVRANNTSILVANGLSPGTGAAYNGDVKCFIEVEDFQSTANYSSGTINSSGINTVTYGGNACTLVPHNTVSLPIGTGGAAANNATVNTADGATGKAWYQYTTNIGSNTSGVTIGVTDKVGKADIETAYLYNIDKIAPVVESAIVKTSDGANLPDGSTWFSNPANLTLTIVDYTTTGNLSQTRNFAGLSNIQLTTTKYSRDASRTKAGVTTPINIGFNPTTSTATSGVVNVNGTAFMTRSKDNDTYATCVVGGVTYYCIRYEITVPILYQSDYKFTITDNAGNSKTSFRYNHNSTESTSYIPNIDQTAPDFGQAVITGYNAQRVSVGNARSNYVNASYLEFKINANDEQFAGINNGSGIKTIQIFAGTKLVSEWTTTTPYQAFNGSSADTLLYVRDTNYSQVLNGTEREQVDLNSCTTASYRIKIIDAAGNTTELVPNEDTLQINPNTTAELTVAVYVDNIIPDIAVYKQDGTTFINPSATIYSGDNTTRIFEYDWTATSQTIQLKYTFGCSGASLYRYANTLADSGRVSIANWSEGGAQNRNDNKQEATEVYSSEGINYYSFKIISGAKVTATGKGTPNDTTGASYTNIVIKVKVDKTAPTFQLLGFGTTISPSGKTDVTSIKNSIANEGGPVLTESLLTTANSYYGKDFTAYYYIKDTFVTTDDNKEGTSWLNGGQAKAYVTVKHADYLYSYPAIYDLLSNSKFTILMVKMYDLSTLKNMKHKTNGVSIYNAGTDSYDLTYGSNVIYNISIKDVVGNTRQVKLGDSIDLSYNVDPFPIHKTVIQTPKDTAYDFDYYGDYKNEVENGWTNLNIKYTIAKQTSISPVVVQYRLVPIKNANTATPEKVGTSDQYEYVDVGDLGSANTATFTLSTQDGSRCAFIEFRVYKSWAKYNNGNDVYTKVDYKDVNGKNQNFIIKQDVNVPQITAVYFSRSNQVAATSQADALSNPLVIAYFKATEKDGSYSYTRLTPEVDVWTFEQLYMYVIASDSLSGSGAGVRSVYLYNQADLQQEAKFLCSANTINADYSGEQVFVSPYANFGYMDATSKNPIYFRLIDYAPEPKQNETPKIAMNTDSAANRILPRVDEVTPKISLKSATYTGGSYIVDGKLSGDSIQENLLINIDFTWGVSGAKIYRVDMAEYFESKYALDPWGFGEDFTGTTKVAGLPSSLQGLLSLGEIAKFGTIMPTSTPGTDPGSGTYEDLLSNNIETKSRYYYFIVSNVNEYAEYRPIGYVAAGDIFIDNIDPVFNTASTFYTSNESGNIMNINDVYTNDDVIANIFVTDGASGVAGVFLKSGSIGNTLKEYREGSPLSSVLKHIGTDARGDQYRFVSMNTNIAYQFIVFDHAGNYKVSAAVTPKIDTVVPEISISAKKANDDTHNGDTHKVNVAGNFTNSPYLKITLTVKLGLSKLGELSYNIDGSENYLPISNLRDKNGNPIQITQNGNNSVAIFDIDKNYHYKFRATNNVLANYSKDGKVPSDIEEMFVDIDVTKPTLNENNAEYKSVKNIWHNTPSNLVLDAADNIGGSGIDFIHMYYSVGGISYDEFFKYNDATSKFETYTLSGEEIVFGGDFALSEFVTYNIEITDIAKNKSQIYEIRPSLDTTAPEFNSAYSMMTVDGVYTGGSLSSPNWTMNNVFVALSPSYTMSGAKVEVSIKNNATGANWSNWINIKDLVWGNNPVLDADAGTHDALGNDFIYEVKPDEGKKSVNAYYKFRIVSNAGLICEEEKTVLIQIDQEVPVFSGTTNISYLNKNKVLTKLPLQTFVSTKEAFVYIFGDAEWTSQSVSVQSIIGAQLASGYTLQFALYNVNTQKWNDWSICSTNPFVHNSDTDGVNYKFRYLSGSQIPSKELIVNAIKVDTKSPSVNLQVRTSYEGESDANGSFVAAPKSAYDFGGGYSTTWTNARYVVVRVYTEFGFSGIDLTFEKDGTKIEENEISIVYGQSGELYYYIPYTVNLRVTANSNAGLNGFATREINIDNLLPELYVSEIKGTKSTNWDESVANSWFTSNVYFQFGVGTYKNATGTLERNLTSGGKSISSPSGYKIQYRIKTATGYTEWSDTNSSTSYGITTMEVVEGRIYRFRIVSNSGMVHELGQDIMYNNEVVASAQKVYDNVKNNYSNALFSHIVEDNYDYLINLDQNTYYLATSQNIKYYDGENVQDSYSNDYANYSYEIYVDGGWINKQDHDRGNDYEYFHGDRIKITYKANYDLAKYLHRYTDYLEYFDTELDGVTTRTVISSNTFTSDDSSEERAGAIEISFTKHNYSIESYFKQELTAVYSQKVAYVQSYRQSDNPTFKSEIDIKYYYTQAGDNLAQQLGATLAYTNMQNGQVQEGNISIQGNNSIGGYLIRATLDHEVNRQSFIITNSEDILLVKYFTQDGTNPYKVNDQNDLEMVSAFYYDSYNPSTLKLDAKVSYLSKGFIQTADIALTQSFVPVGEFTGKYDGGGKTITFANSIEANGGFGLFTSIKGTIDVLASVSNLAVNIPNLRVVNATNVGALAQSISNAKVNNIWINAKITIDSSNQNASIGGLVGISDNAQIGGLSANYIDARIYHNGNVLGNNLSDGASIGGVIGRANQNTYLFNTYNFGGMEVYGVENAISIGAVIGTLASYVTEANLYNFFGTNSYLKGNVFVNGELNNEFIGTDNSVKAIVTASGLYYTDFVELDNIVVDRTIKDSVLQKLYTDFGMTVSVDAGNNVYTNGLGTLSDMLIISTVEQIEAINEYVMLNYRLAGDIDMTGFNQSIAAHKIFTGILDGKMGQKDAMLTNFTGEIYEGYYGLFANFDGTVQNIVFDDLKVDIDYQDNNDLYIGLVAGKSYENADINNIIAIGSVKINAPNSNVVAGGLVGKANYGYIYNIFNMANIKVSAQEISLGGIIGEATNTVLVNYEEISDAIFSLARVEGNYASFGDVGAIVGAGNILEAISDMSKVFALVDNTYTNGSLKNSTIGSSSVNSAQLKTFGDTAMRSVSVSDGNLFNEVFVTQNLYPLQGISENLSSTVGADLDNPFKITSEEDFKYINNALYAYYRIVAPNNRIMFNSFETIGEGLFFTGRIDGKTAESGSAEAGEVVSLDGVSDSLIYYNKGAVSDLSLNVNYTKNLTSEENATFGTIAKYNDGTIRNVIVSGDITINGGNSVTASGFVGVDYGGIIDNSSIKNSISSVNITANGASTVYIGGYIGKIIGTTTVSFAIGQGNIYIIDCPSYYAGWLIGSAEGDFTVDLSLIQNYAYTINITEDGVTAPPIPATEENYTGLKKVV